MAASGGTGSSGSLSDLWRRSNVNNTDSASSEWMLVAEGSDVTLGPRDSKNAYGSTMLLSPWGILSMGGMLRAMGVGPRTETWILDPVSRRWSVMPVEEREIEAHSPRGRCAVRVTLDTAICRCHGSKRVANANLCDNVALAPALTMFRIRHCDGGEETGEEGSSYSRTVLSVCQFSAICVPVCACIVCTSKHLGVSDM